MAGDTMRSRNPAGHAGLFRTLLSLVSALAGFFGSRLELLAKESQIALIHALIIVGCVALAAVLGIFGYLCLVVSLVAGLAHALHIWWIWIALALAGLHFVLAAICVLVARAKMKTPIFESIALELKKDREWLKNLENNNHFTN
jgi:uncharacterized membrane protein YqjE